MSFFSYKFLQKYKFKSKSIYIIFDHTTIYDSFVILQFLLKVGKRAIPHLQIEDLKLLIYLNLYLLIYT